MKKLIAVMGWTCMIVAAPAFAQKQVDVAFGAGSLSAPASIAAPSLPNFAQSLNGGGYVGFSGDVLIKRDFGVQGEMNWRASQSLYGGQIPYRPFFWDFNGIYARRFNQFVGAEALAGIGAESIRFYPAPFNCDLYSSCSSYISSTHFMGDVGGGVRLYPYRNFFVRPEMRLYLVSNNVQFSSSRALRYGVSVGYTFGKSK